VRVGLEGVEQRPEQPEQGPVDEDDLVLGVVHDVGDLLGEQADVERVQHPAAARGGEVQLEVVGRVPGERGHAAVGADAQVVEGTAEATGALGPLAVAAALDAGGRRGDDALLREQGLGPVEEVRQRERTVLHEALHRFPLGDERSGGGGGRRRRLQAGAYVVVTGDADAGPGYRTAAPGWETRPLRPDDPTGEVPAPDARPATGADADPGLPAAPEPDRERPAPAVPDPDPEGGATSGSAGRSDEPRPGRARLSVLISAIVVLLVCSNLANAFFPTLSTEYPLVLIALSAANRNLILASGQVPFVAYFFVATFRLILPDIAFYLLGYDYGDRALGWMERRTPRVGAMMRELESLFGRFGYVIVLVLPLLIPSNPICLIAGAARMRPRVFWTLNLIGIVGRVLIMLWIGDVFSGAVDWLLDFIAQYRLPLTAVTVGIVGFTFWRETRSGTSDIQQLLELEDELEADDGRPSPP
jgi:membrane protein DedA with SNARE-associated domain